MSFLKKAIPSALTSMNLLCGFWAILINDPVISFYYVLVAIAFDFVDGLSARALKVQSLFGKELDSLADMVTFGVAPTMLVYHLMLLVGVAEPIAMSSLIRIALVFMAIPVADLCLLLRCSFIPTSSKWLFQALVTIPTTSTIDGGLKSIMALKRL